MREPSKLRVDCYIGQKEFLNLITYQHKHGINTLSQAVHKIIKAYFEGEQQLVIKNLHTVISNHESKIQELEHEIEHNKLKEGDKNRNRGN